MTTKQKIEAAKYEVGNVAEELRVAYAHGVALRKIVGDKEMEIAAILATGGWANPLAPMADASFIMGLATSPILISLPILKALLEVSEHSQAFKAGVSIIQPLVDQIAELELELATEDHAYHTKLAQLRDLEQAAQDKAAASAAKDPEAAKLRAEIQASRPAHLEAEAPPFRGRVELNSQLEAVPG